MVLSGSSTINQSISKPVLEVTPEGTTIINLKDSRTLAINDQKVEKSLSLKLLNSKGAVVATSEIKSLQMFYVSPDQMLELKG